MKKTLTERAEAAVMEGLHGHGVSRVIVEPVIDVLDNDGWRVTVVLESDDDYWTRKNVEDVRTKARQILARELGEADMIGDTTPVVQVAEKAPAEDSSAPGGEPDLGPQPGEGQAGPSSDTPAAPKATR